MNSSIRLFTVRGIDIRLHITFPLILLWAAFQFGLAGSSLNSAIFGVVAISFLFVLVTLHELGHSFAAQYFGVPVERIVLSPIGGVAQLRNIPENPWQEFVIAIAGPAVNVVAAIIMGLIALAPGLTLANPLAVLTGAGGFGLSALFTYIFVYNIFLAVFNLIPAFPMDGGRVLRALLAMRLDYVRATDIAAAVGRAAAVLMGIYGLFNGGIFLLLIAFFIYFGASAEAQAVRQRQALRGFTVQQVFSSSVYRLSAHGTLQQALDLMMFSGQTSIPVMEAETLVGIVTRPVLLQAMRTLPPHTPISQIMRRDVPQAAPYEDLNAIQQRLDEERLEALPVVDNGWFLGLITRRHIGNLYQLATA